MHIAGYILVLLVTSYSAIRVFGLGWATKPASFLNVLLMISLLNATAGIIAALPKKAKLKAAFICAIPYPTLISLLMAQGIFENKAFHLLHWLTLPLAAVIIVTLAFYLTKKIRNSQNNECPRVGPS